MSGSGEPTSIEVRKGEHVELAATAEVDLAEQEPWSGIRFEHEALPEINLEDVDLTVTFLGHRLQAPLLIAGMNGGPPAPRQITPAPGVGAARHGLSLGLGSQRAALV